MLFWLLGGDLGEWVLLLGRGRVSPKRDYKSGEGARWGSMVAAKESTME